MRKLVRGLLILGGAAGALALLLYSTGVCYI